MLTSPADEREAVAAYTCSAAHPSPPVAPMTTEQIDYLYGYLTQYLVPCWEANGVTTVPEAPGRADFVAQWPEQGWFPTLSGEFLTAEAERAIDEVCIRPV